MFLYPLSILSYSLLLPKSYNEILNIQSQKQKTFSHYRCILHIKTKQWCTHTRDEVDVFFWLAEEAADVHDADRAVHAATDPILVLVPLRQPVPEDLKGFPHRLLTH